MTDLALTKRVFESIGAKMTENRDYLIQLDAQNGDGDLGISMDTGFRAVNAYLAESDETDLGQLFRRCAKEFNEASPSSLGTILSFIMTGVAKTLRGKTQADLAEMALALMPAFRP